MNDDNVIEKEIQDKKLIAPRVTPADIEANIASEIYFTADEGFAGAEASGNGSFQVINNDAAPAGALRTMTFCVLVLRNGFTVTGEAACASPENFDAELGRKIARQKAISNLWPLMGYALKQKLHDDASSFGSQLYAAAKAQTEATEGTATA